MIFSDEKKLVVARRWCWWQSDESAAREQTTNVIITVEAHHANGRDDVRKAIDDLLSLLKKYAGGTFDSAVLDTATPTI